MSERPTGAGTDPYYLDEDGTGNRSPLSWDERGFAKGTEE